MIRTLVADDQEVVRAGFSALLETQLSGYKMHRDRLVRQGG